MYSIILPVFKELENLKILVPEIKNVLKEKKYEIIIIDDNSDDGTSEYIQSNFPEITYLNRKLKEPSLGASVGDGIKISKYQFIMVMDSDLSHNTNYLLEMIEYQKVENYNLICCSRFFQIKPKDFSIRFYLSKIYCYFLKIFLSLQTNDALSGFFLLEKKCLDNTYFDEIFYGYGDFYFRLLFYLKKKKIKYTNIGFKWQNRKLGESKTKFLSIFVKYTFEAVKLKFKN